jgi:sigma-B regulation protein RsbU (phosphoserine phosphatase)
LTTSPRYLQVNQQGEKTALPICFQQQVLALAPGANREVVTADAHRLAALTPHCRDLYNQNSKLVFWLYTALDNGVYSSYPGHSEYPADYDPRRREWYQRAKSLKSVIWIPPNVDTASGQPVLTATMPVYQPDGQFAGVTAVDMVVSELIEETRLPTFGSPAAHLVVLAPLAEPLPTTRPRDRDVTALRPEDLGLLVILHPTGAKEVSRSTVGPHDWLESGDREVFLEMIRDMQAGQSGVRQMDYHGRRSIWAYGPIWRNLTYSVVVVPDEQVTSGAVRAEETVLGMTYTQLKIRAAIALAVVLIVLVVSFFTSRTVTRSIRQLAEAADQIAEGHLDVQVNVRSNDEIGDLGRRFNEMVPALRDRLKLRQALSLAMEVQQNLLPSRPPQIEGLDVAGTSIYCDETGGDYYDFLELSEISPGELGIAVGDVTGHGIAAALLMTTARAILRSRIDQPGTLADLMQSINRHLTADTPPGRFMTLLYVVIDARTRGLRWANAGHDPALIYDPVADRFTELEGGSLPLGIDLQVDYQEYRWDQLKCGQVIVIGTDGIWETHNPQHETFGKDALRKVVRRHAAGSAADIVQAITTSLAEFRQDHPQEDDVTLVVIKITP